MKRFITAVVCFIFIFLPAMPAVSGFFSSTETLRAVATYPVGEHDTEQSALLIAGIQAKGHLLDKVRIYLTSGSSDVSFTDAEFAVFAPALVRMETTKEEVNFVKNAFEVVVALKTDVNRRDFNSALTKLKRDTALTEKVRKQQTAIAATEDRLLEIQDKLVQADEASVMTLLRERDQLQTRLATLKKEAITRDAVRKNSEETLRERFQFD